MIRKVVIVALTLASISISVLWFSLIDASSRAYVFDRHCMGYAMILHNLDYSGSFFNYRGYPCFGIEVQWTPTRPYNVVIIPLWSLIVIFSCYPIIAFLRRANRRRYVERAWFALAVGMSTWAFVAFQLLYSESYPRIVDRAFSSEYTSISVLLVILISVPAICAILVHNVIAGPIRRASLRKPRMCFVCGYNLTGNVSGKCSECGQPIAEAETKLVNQDIE